MSDFRPGNIVKPYERLDQEQIDRIHEASMAILEGRQGPEQPAGA
ncbi:MAG: trimethylamine methyltransferase family protein [Desulfobulbaceae bacterium]|nr:trimethylamine methyltransferase family protein [Desulfobulbaceae bacterium]